MFCKINGKYYVKVSNFYQEVKVKDDNIVPIQGEANRLYSPVLKAEEVTVEEILKSTTETVTKDIKKKPKQEKRKIF